MKYLAMTLAILFSSFSFANITPPKVADDDCDEPIAVATYYTNIRDAGITLQEAHMAAFKQFPEDPLMYVLIADVIYQDHSPAEETIANFRDQCSKLIKRKNNLEPPFSK